MHPACRSTHARHAQALPAFLAGALMAVWMMFGWLDVAQAQTVRIAPAAQTSISEPGGSGLGALDATLEQRLEALAMAGARQVAPNQARVDVELGRLDPRLRLAPCAQIQPYLPPGSRMWGKTRLGLRCVAGVTKWNVTLPLTIKVFGQAYVAGSDLPAGTVLTQEHLRLAEVDIAGDAGAIYTQADAWMGRSLSRPMVAGEALRSSDLKLRHWVQPGDRVQVMATGDGYAIAGEGQAMGVGLEGQDVRVRFDNGRMVTGRTIGERRVEVVL